MSKRYFISFADSRMSAALRRIRRQAEAMQFFDGVRTLTERDLDTDFCRRHADLLKRGVRGFGYWIWKPQILRQCLANMSEGDELYYLDAGCHLNPRGRERMLDYARELAANPLGLAAFQLGDDCSEKAFCKGDLLQRLGVLESADILERGQLCATHIFCVKRAGLMQLIRKWSELADEVHLIDDSPSIYPDFPEFVEHRHDQSIFSLLGKLHGALALPGNETWPAGNTRNWKLLENYPIWDKRDLGLSMHSLERLMRKLRRLSTRLLHRKS